MNGDGFGPDDWPDDHPGSDAPEDRSTEPLIDDQHLTGSGEHDPHDAQGEMDDGVQHDAEDDSSRPDPAGIDAPADFDGPDGPAGPGDDVDPHHDADQFDADAEAETDGDDRHREGTGSLEFGDRWAAAIGYGAVDPSGAQPGLFDHVDLSGADGAQDVEPEWLTEELAEARATWVDPSLFDASGASERTSLLQASGVDAVSGLWARLAPEAPMPADPADALDALAARAGATPLRQVLETARRLLDG